MPITISEKISSHATQRFGKVLGNYSLFFRSLAEAVENNPNLIFEHVQHPAVKTLYELRTLSALEFFKLYEALSYGDIGVLFAAPRSCLSGILLQCIGSFEQEEEYFSALCHKPKRTFFATTEPNHGSDASQIETFFDAKSDPDNIIIQGEKILVGNLGVANTGVIIGRTNHSLLGINAAWIKPEDFSRNSDNVRRDTLPLFGIKPALLGHAKFNQFVIPKSQLIGQHKSPMERGLQALIKTFNVMRLGITGLALGHAASVIDYIRSNRYQYSSGEHQKLQQWETLLCSLRNLSLQACQKQQENPLETSLISLVKMRASHLAENISTEALSFFPQSVVFEHPFLTKPNPSFQNTSKLNDITQPHFLLC